MIAEGKDLTSPAVVAVDVGGTGARAMFDAGGVRQSTVSAAPLRVGPDGPRVREAVTSVLAELDRLYPSLAGPAAVVVAASGVVAAGEAAAAETLALLRRRWPTAAVALVSDAVAALVAAVGPAGGACVAVGTGVVGLGSDLDEVWHRVDGWGLFLGDEGGGAWIGRAGLRAALKALDGRSDGSEPLRRLAVAHFGRLADLPQRLSEAEDRAALLSGFAPLVARAARAGDPVAQGVWEDAGTRIGRTAVACLRPGVPRKVAVCGGLVQARDLLAPSLVAAVQEAVGLTPILVEASVLSGAQTLARALAANPDSIRDHAPLLRKDLP